MAGTGDVVASSLLVGIGAWAWLRRRYPVGGKAWAFRIVPPGVALLLVVGDEWPFAVGGLVLIFVLYARAAHCGGWRLEHPENRCLNGLWWILHIAVYFFMVLVLCGLLVGIVQTGIRFSPFATEGDWPWTKGRVTEALPFAVEYRRAKTFCAEYDKRVVFRSGKRVGLLMDTCGYGPFRVYRLKDGTYCLEDGFGLANDVRHQRVDVKRETVELKQGGAWYAIPGGGFIRGYGGVPGSLSLTFSMYPGGDLNNEEGWDVDVTGTPVGDSLDGMELIGEIETSGRFFSLED